MIISLDDARAIDIDITQDDLDAFEISVRELTNNNFQNTFVRYQDVEFVNENTVLVKGKIIGLRVGDTVEVNYSHYNDGLYVIDQIDGKQITVQGAPFFASNTSHAMLTKVEYPADIKRGIKKLIEYDKAMAGKVGIKSETIARMSITYYDVTAAESSEGYPVSLLGFLDKYRKLRWS